MYFLVNQFTWLYQNSKPQSRPAKKKKKKSEIKRGKQSRGSFPEPESANAATYKEEALFEN